MILFSFDYPPHGGGISRLCSYISSGLHKTGIQHQVLSEGDLVQPDVIRVSKHRVIRELQSIYWLIKNTDRNTPILTGTWYPEALLCFLAFRKNVYILAHGTEILPAQNVFKESIWKILRKVVLANARLCIANSHFTKDLVLQSAPNAKATALPLAVDSEKFRVLETAKKQNAELVIGTVSRIHAYKGFDTVLNALATLPEDQRLKVKYKIVGSGPYKEKLIQLVQTMGLQQQVEFVGALDEQELIQFYNSIDLFVMCSRLSRRTQDVEGFGLVYLEAQACGAPVIATRSGGIPDAVTNGEGGWLIEENDYADLSNKIMGFLQNPETLTVASKMARQRVESKFLWKDYIKSLLKLLGLENA